MTIRFHQAALVVSCTVVSLALNGTAFAQIKPGVNAAKDKPAEPSKEEKRKEIDEKYRETLKAIPDPPQKKVDPWANVRGSTKKRLSRSAEQRLDRRQSSTSPSV